MAEPAPLTIPAQEGTHLRYFRGVAEGYNIFFRVPVTSWCVVTARRIMPVYDTSTKPQVHSIEDNGSVPQKNGDFVAYRSGIFDHLGELVEFDGLDLLDSQLDGMY